MVRDLGLGVRGEGLRLRLKGLSVLGFGVWGEGLRPMRA